MQQANAYIHELEAERTALRAEIERLTQQVATQKDLVEKAQALADMRGQAILTLTEKWSERRAYHRTQFKTVVALKNKLAQRVKELEDIDDTRA